MIEFFFPAHVLTTGGGDSFTRLRGCLGLRFRFSRTGSFARMFLPRRRVWLRSLYYLRGNATRRWRMRNRGLQGKRQRSLLGRRHCLLQGVGILLRTELGWLVKGWPCMDYWFMSSFFCFFNFVWVACGETRGCDSVVPVLFYFLGLIVLGGGFGLHV